MFRNYGNWFRSRCKNNARMEYLKSPDEIRQDNNIEAIFNTFDKDNSGSLDISEIFEMFIQNGMASSATETPYSEQKNEYGMHR